MLPLTEVECAVAAPAASAWCSLVADSRLAARDDMQTVTWEEQEAAGVPSRVAWELVHGAMGANAPAYPSASTHAASAGRAVQQHSAWHPQHSTAGAYLAGTQQYSASHASTGVTSAVGGCVAARYAPATQRHQQLLDTADVSNVSNVDRIRRDLQEIISPRQSARSQSRSLSQEQHPELPDNESVASDSDEAFEWDEWKRLAPAARMEICNEAELRASSVAEERQVRQERHEAPKPVDFQQWQPHAPRSFRLRGPTQVTPTDGGLSHPAPSLLPACSHPAPILLPSSSHPPPKVRALEWDTLGAKLLK